MMGSNVAIWVIALTYPFFLAKAYVNDPASCKGETAVWLQGQIDCAFQIAQDAVDALNNPNRDQRITDLLDNLFESPSEPLHVTPSQAILSRFAGTQPPPGPNGQRIGGMDFNHPGVLSMRNYQTGDPSPLDVKFFCNTDRFEKVSGEGGQELYRDNENMELQSPSFHPLKECKSHNMAFTFVPTDPHHSSTITICPWFLNYAQHSAFPKCGDLHAKFKGLLAKKLDSVVSKINGYTPIDLFSIFDKVMLHELTHTRAGGKTYDAGMDPEGSGDIANTAYGFKKCKAIRSRVMPDNKDTDTPYSNADTFALFASGVRLINAGGSVDGNGKITKPTNQRRFPLVAVEFES